MGNVSVLVLAWYFTRWLRPLHYLSSFSIYIPVESMYRVLAVWTPANDVVLQFGHTTDVPLILPSRSTSTCAASWSFVFYKEGYPPTKLAGYA